MTFKIRNDIQIPPIMFELMDLIGDDAYIAGSSVVSLLHPAINANDIDIFCKAEHYETIKRKLNTGFFVSYCPKNEWVHEGVYDKLGGKPFNIQLIKQTFQTPEDVLKSFDLTCAMALVTPNKEILYHEDIDTKQGRVYKVRDLARIFRRMLKYKSYGFTFDKAQWELIISLVENHEFLDPKKEYIFDMPIHQANNVIPF